MVIAGYVASTLSGATSITLTTTLTHIYLGDEKIATFQSQTDDTPKTSDDNKLIYHISDHLNSSSLDLLSTGVLMQAVDYLPFGKSNTYEITSKRVKGKKGGYTNKYQFANKQLDEESDLQYFEKRYYDNRIGRFTTEDPVFWEVGLTKRPNQYFNDPQSWNTYSYTRNNPINLVDPTGECWFGEGGTSCWDTYKKDAQDAIKADDFLLNFSGYIAQQNIVDPVNTAEKAKEGDKGAMLETGINTLSFLPAGKLFNAIKPGKTIINKEIKALEKGINSLINGNRGINIHLDKIKNPLKYLNDAVKRNQFLTDSRYREGLINKWKKEVETMRKEVQKKQDKVNQLKSNQ